MKSVERSWTWGGGSGWGGQDSLYCPRSSQCFKLSPWSSPASLGIPHIHSSTPHFSSSRGKTSQMGHVSESLDSAWQLCAVSHGSHPPCAALSTWDRPVQSSMWDHREDFKTRSEKRTLSSLDVFRKFYIVSVAHIIFLTDSTVHLKVSQFVSAFGWTQKGLLRKKFLYIRHFYWQVNVRRVQYGPFLKHH